MKKIFIIMICIACTALIGCETSSKDLGTDNTDTNVTDNFGDDNIGIEGYVVAKDDGRILVVDPIPQDFSANGGVPEFYNAIWLSGDTEQIDIGQMVHAWFDVVLYSYPGQAQATKLLVIESEKADGADLSEAEVVRKALASDKLNNEAFVVVIKAVAYDKTTDSWKVIAKQGEDEISIEVIDELD